MAEPREDENIVDESKIQQFCAVTGTTVEAARELLKVCCGNLEMAIGMHMDGSCDAVPACNSQPHPQGSSSSTSSSGAQASAYLDEEDDIRAPIPQRREVLVEELSVLGHRMRNRRAARSVFDGFRDFQAEARQQEQNLMGGQVVAGGSKKRTLEDLFRPPIELTYKGTFQNARDVGTKQNKWLLVNVQNVQEFPCQVLNRDIWSCPHIRKLIKDHFIFWQVYHDSAEGKKYMQFYKIKDWPYVAIVDPRTGENLAEWSKIVSSSALRVMLQDFLAYHQNPDAADSSPPSKRMKREPSIVDASEEDQIEAAIKASLKQDSPVQDDSCIFVDTDSDAQSEDLETFSDSDEDSQTPSTAQCHISEDSIQSTKDSKDKICANVKCVASTSSSRRTDDVKDPVSVSSNSQTEVSSCEMEQKEEEVETEPAEPAEPSRSVNGLQTEQEEEVKPTGPEMNLLIRFPDGAKEHLNIPCDSTIKALLKFVTSKGVKSEDFELVTNFPRRQLHLLNPSTTLSAAGLHTKDTLFVHCL